jgi:protoporphyrinogen IX oxidase
MGQAYLYVKAFHVMAVIAWMAGIFYLPRLFVYHTSARPGSRQSETFKVMEGKLLGVIMNPAMITSWILGLVLIFVFHAGDLKTDGWLHAKLGLVLLLTIYHLFLAKWRRDFANDRNCHTARFYRIMNEVPTVLMLGIVIFVIVKPF